MTNPKGTDQMHPYTQCPVCGTLNYAPNEPCESCRNETLTTLERMGPGESVDIADGYIARNYADGYYAESADEISPTFATYAEALAWLERAR